MHFRVRSGGWCAAVLCAIAYSIPVFANAPATVPATAEVARTATTAPVAAPALVPATQAAEASKPATTIASTKPVEVRPPSPLAAGPKLLFNRDIRPIIGDTCLKCHGFDPKARKADLRLDTREGALADLGGGDGAIVPGHPEDSEAIRRLLSDDPEEKMPPPKSGIVLTASQIDTLQRWIAQGAEYQPLWSLIKPVASSPPDVQLNTWPRNDIDRFILARMEKEGLKPNPEADKVTLIRRVTLDLTGMPPTLAEVDAFLADDSANAYEALVDRLLGSTRYGERMAMRWLDLARYADTNGYQEDNHRSMYRWRDWVIDAFNDNKPFDQFTVEQIAGDLLPNATIDQKTATGFNRNHRITVEGGVIPEEFRTEYVLDRVDTTATTWLGLTMGCARCHDHKYDPITQKEFYQFFAFFNNVPELGLGIPGRDRNFDPMIPAPMKAEQIKLGQIEAGLAIAEKSLKEMEPKVIAAQAAYEPLLAKEPADPALAKGLIAYFPLDGDANDVVTKGVSGLVRNGDGPFAEGMVDQAANFNGKRVIDLDDIGSFERTMPFSISAWAYPLVANDAAVVARQNEGDNVRGYTLFIQRGLVHFQLIAKFPGNALMLVSKAPISSDTWHQLTATYDGSSKAAGAKVYLDGKPLDMTVASDNLTESILTSVPTQIGGRNSSGRFLGKIDDVRFYNRPLTPEEVATLSSNKTIARSAVKIPLAHRSAEKVKAVRAAFLEQGPPEMREAFAKVESLKTQRQQINDAAPTVMVMAEMPKPRETHILKRGQYDQPGDVVTAGVPACMPPMPTDAPANRLGLAKWLVDPSNPLVARVAVNRYWQTYFGTGLEKTAENFGSQAEYPTHLELLDWLAVKFIESKWDVKAMQKLIVTSATYRQSSTFTKEHLEKDPTNKWLSRGPRLRLPAETIRDDALAMSGLLVEKLGGPSVKSYQPEGLWAELATPGGIGQTFVQDHGQALYRRSLYSYWKRTVPPPTMAAFDAPTREVCTVNRSRTNTPIQALALMNDVVYVEASRKLAERCVAEGGVKPAERLTHAFRLAVARKPTDAELKILVDDFNFHLATYFSAPEQAAKLLGAGESTKNPSVDQRELAAYTAVASVILNLDETITRE